MSAFIVQDKTINQIVNWLIFDDDYPSAENTYGEVSKIIKDEFKIDFNHSEAREILAYKMYQLNCKAVDHRYNEQNDDCSSNFKYLFKYPTNRAQALKSLSCWLYQCSEGDIPKSKLYKVFKRVQSVIAYHIATSTPEYEQAGWDD